MAEDKVYPDGIFWNQPRDGAPDFVIGNLNIPDKKVFIQWLQSQSTDRISIDVNFGRSGKPYTQLNTFEPKSQASENIPAPTPSPDTIEGFPEDDIPF